MIQLIVGTKGSGKTKKMIDMINDAVSSSDGQIICVEKNMKLTYSISHAVRLIDVDDYQIDSYAAFYGFFCGLLASNYDVTEVFVDGLVKIGNGLDGLGETLDRINAITDSSVKVVISISADVDTLSDDVKKFL